jgi:hypothetical protein
MPIILNKAAIQAAGGKYRPTPRLDNTKASAARAAPEVPNIQPFVEELVAYSTDRVADITSTSQAEIKQRLDEIAAGAQNDIKQHVAEITAESQNEIKRHLSQMMAALPRDEIKQQLSNIIAALPHAAIKQQLSQILAALPQRDIEQQLCQILTEVQKPDGSWNATVTSRDQHGRIFKVKFSQTS